MYKSFIGKEVSFVVTAKGATVYEYVGILSSESENSVELSNVTIMGFQPAMPVRFKKDLEKVILNKKFIISCDSL